MICMSTMWARSLEVDYGVWDEILIVKNLTFLLHPKDMSFQLQVLAVLFLMGRKVWILEQILIRYRTWRALDWSFMYSSEQELLSRMVTIARQTSFGRHVPPEREVEGLALRYDGWGSWGSGLGQFNPLLAWSLVEIHEYVGSGSKWPLVLAWYGTWSSLTLSKPLQNLRQTRVVGTNNLLCEETKFQINSTGSSLLFHPLCRCYMFNFQKGNNRKCNSRKCKG